MWIRNTRNFWGSLLNLHFYFPYLLVPVPCPVNRANYVPVRGGQGPNCAAPLSRPKASPNISARPQVKNLLRVGGGGDMIS